MKYLMPFAFFCCCLCNIIYAQTVTVSEELPVRNDNSYAIIGKMNDHLLLFRDKVNNQYEVQAFDHNLMTGWNKDLDFEEKKIKILEVIPGNKTFNIVYSYRKGGDVGLKINTYDPAAELVDSSTIILYDNKYITPNFKVKLSEDKNIMLLYYFESQKEVNAIAYDLKYKTVLWNRSFEPEEVNYFRDFTQILIDDRGNMYIIFDKNNRKGKKEEHHFHVYQVLAQSGQIKDYKLPLNGFLTFDVNFSYDNLNNALVAAGLFSEKNRIKANGYFFLNINSDNPDSFKLNFEALDEKFISNFMGKAGKSVSSITDTSVKEIIHRKDGGILMIAERTKKYERRLNGGGRGYTADGKSFIVDYYFEDLFVISIHPDGKKHWSSILHKKQYSQDDDGMYSSFFVLKTPQNLRLLFNDEIKYENTVSEYVINGSGKCDRNSVLSTDDQKIKLRFRDAVQIAANEIIVPSERKQQLKLIRIIF